jgi:class 3 adenylate cyclase/predicted ATPase/ribosomal protein L40E
MLCLKCNYDNPADALFCMKCGTKVENRCSSCNSVNPADARFCRKCGRALGAGAPASSPSPAASAKAPRVELTHELQTGESLEGERKTVTALFADIKGSTELMRDLDPEEARAIVDPVLQLMMAAVHRYGGYVAQSTGDGIFALFGAPIAHEDHPQRALHAALAMQEELRRYADRLRADGKTPVEARVGVNTGEVVVRTIETGGHTEYTPVGHVTNLAAQMQTAAPAGSIAASEATQRLCEGYFEFRALGPTAVKGLDAPVEVYEVVRAGPLKTHFQLAARRGLTKFVGREREMAAMAGALEQASAGHGQIVAAVGEAGAGKSRLMYEFKATIPDGCKVLEAYSVSHGKASAWLPVLELLRGYFGFQDADHPATRREKVRATLAALDQALSEVLPYLLGLLGIHEGPDPLAQMDRQIRRRRTLEAIKRIILRESLEHAQVVIFEDLHWIDSETQALLDILADSGAGARLLLLVNYRPDYRHEWSGRGHYLQLRLDPLGGEQGAAMLAALLGGGVELEALKRLIIERTEGNPFFIEEMVQALFDEGALVRNGAVKVARSLSQLRLPPTVQGILASRIDRLSAEQKELLQTLAVIGRESPLGLIREVASKAEAQLERMLADLRAAEFIYEQPALTDAEYIFKHALTQEVAYNSLLIGRRKLLHERAGHALESMFAEQLDDHVGELAHHYSHSDNVAKAVEYLGRAGRQALQRSAHTAAIGNLMKAIDLLPRLPDGPERIQRELQLQLVLGPALSAIKGWSAPEVERAYFRARELCKRLGDPPELFHTLVGVWLVYYIRGEARMAHELAEQLMNRAQSRNDSTHLLVAHDAIGSTSLEMGKLLPAREHKEAVISLYDPARHGPFLKRTSFDMKGYALSYLAHTLWLLGYPDQALKRANEAVEFTQALSHPLSLAGVEFFLSMVHQFRQEARATQKAAERAIALSAEHGFTFWLAIATILRGWAIAQHGLNEEGIAQMEKGLAAFRATGAGTGRPHWLSLLAEACAESGRLNDGLSVLAEAKAFANETEARGYEAEIYRLKGELLLKQDNSNAAEAQGCFQRAIEIARNQSAKSWELRATTSLARLLAKQGKRDEARTMLSDIYGWFTEGFDTADLKDAKALLNDLNG